MLRLCRWQSWCQRKGVAVIQAHVRLREVFRESFDRTYGIDVRGVL